MTVDRATDAPRAEDSAVWAEGVHKAYRAGATVTPVLCGVDLAVRRGECVFLAGPSGSGKTTLLSILGCILSADRGRVRVADEELAGLDEPRRAALRRHRIGFVFQRFHLIRGLSVLDNVRVPLVLRAAPPDAARRRALDLLDAVGLADMARSHPRNLSAGQCQRVAIARALVADPPVILADEPTASLDAVSGQETMELFHRLTAQDGKTAVVVTHDPRIFRYADRVFHLDGGRIVRTEQQPSDALACTAGV
ncbi:MAG: ABC transporter ATP-binding protein [Pirellulales bacterium]|nr:ABC transporter ATP-binding protein [Pirellulales bacterium]